VWEEDTITVQWLDGDGVGVDVVAATTLWMVPPASGLSKICLG
jgi:hypothetical protein